MDAIIGPTHHPCSGDQAMPLDRPDRLQARGAVPGVALLLLAAGLVGCQARPRPAAQRPTPVRSQPVLESRFLDTIDTVSTLEARDEVELAAQASGRIQRLLVRQGDRVRQGQLLLVLDQAQIRADVARLRALAATSRLHYQRYEWLVGQGAASAFQRDQFRQEAISAREQLVARQADLAFRQLRAPIDGVVGDLRVKTGDVIEAGASLASLIRNDRLMARVEVPAVASARLRLGQPVALLDPGSGRVLTQAPVVSLDPQVVPGTQAVLVKAAFDNRDGSLRDGLRLRSRLVLEERRQPAVPFSAVSQLAGQSFVYVVGDRAALERRPGRVDLASLQRLPASSRFALQTPVRLGGLQGNRYPVLAGVEAGERVITSNLFMLRHGMPVTVRP
jgi:RND family efflux transporter MFP subunit